MLLKVIQLDMRQVTIENCSNTKTVENFVMLKDGQICESELKIAKPNKKSFQRVL